MRCRLFCVLLCVAASLASEDAGAQQPELDRSLPAPGRADIRGVAFVDGFQDMCVADASQGRIFRYPDILDTVDLQEIDATASFAVEGALADLGYGERFYLIFAGVDDSVITYDLWGRQTDRFTAFEGPVSGVAVGGDRIYVSNAEGTAARVFERRLIGLEDVRYDRFIFGGGTRIVHGLAYDEARDRMWVSDDERKLVLAYDNLLDAGDGEVVEPVAQFRPPFVELYDMDFSQQLEMFFLCTGGADRLVGYDRDGQELDQFTTGLGFCAGVAAHGDRIWVGDNGRNVRVFQRLGRGSYRLAPSPSTGAEAPTRASATILCGICSGSTRGRAWASAR